MAQQICRDGLRNFIKQKKKIQLADTLSFARNPLFLNRCAGLYLFWLILGLIWRFSTQSLVVGLLKTFGLFFFVIVNVIKC